MAALDPRAVRGDPGRHHPGRVVGADRAPTRPTSRSPDGRCRPSATAPRWCCRPTRPVAGAAARAAAPAPRSTSPSRCCTAASARTARSRACSRWPACPTSGPACSPARPRWTRSSPRSCSRRPGSPVGDYVVVRGDRAGRSRPTSSTWACRCSSSRPGPVRASASARSRDWDELAAAVELAREHDDKVLIEAAVVGREIEVGVLEGRRTGARPPACRPRSGWSRGHDWYDFDAKYLDDACEFDVPADLDAATTAAAAGRGRAGVRGARLRRPGPGRLLPAPGRRGSS